MILKDSYLHGTDLEGLIRKIDYDIPNFKFTFTKAKVKDDGSYDTLVVTLPFSSYILKTNAVDLTTPLTIAANKTFNSSVSITDLTAGSLVVNESTRLNNDLYANIIKSGTWNGSVIAASYIGNLSTDKLTSGTLGIARGGTGATTLTGVVIGNGTNPMTDVKPSTKNTTYWLKAVTSNTDSFTTTYSLSTIGKSDVGLGNVENKSSATIRGEITSKNVTDALGYTPYNSTNPNGYITESANITGTAAGITGYSFKTLSATGVSGWTNNTTDDKIIPTMSFIAYWNGAYSGNNSNITKVGTISSGKWQGTAIADTYISSASNWNSVYNWYQLMTTGSTDGIINKWKEVEAFLANYGDSTTLAAELAKLVTLGTTLTITGTKSFSNPISGNLLGNATTADRFKNAVTVSLTGNVTGSATFDGSGNLSISTTVSGGSATDNTKVLKAGDTMTGDLTISKSLAGIGNSRITLSNKNTTDNKTSRAYIAAYYANENGANMVINPAGNLFIGSGESASALYALKTTDTGEVSYITSDNLIYLYSNCLAIGNRIGFQVDNSGNLLPYKAEAVNSNALNLGSSTAKFANVYATTFNGNAATATTASGLTTSAVATGYQLQLKGSTTGSNAVNAANPRIEFSNSARNLYCLLVYSDYDIVLAQDSLTLIGNQSGTYFIAPNIKATNLVKSSLGEIDSLTAGNLVVSGSSSVGTVIAGIWNGNKIDKSYLTLNSITAGTAGTSSATSGTSITIPYVTMDAQGLVTGYGTHTHTITLPTGNITSHLYVTNSSGTTKTSTALTNGNVYLKLYEGTTAGESYKISGSGHIKVTTDTSGNISIYNDIATPLSATNKALSSASWVTIADCSNISNYPIGTYALQITDAGTDATNYYSGFITLSGTVGRLDEVALHAQMATVSDNDIPKRIYIAVEKGIIKASSLDSSATNHKLTVKVTRLI